MHVFKSVFNKWARLVKTGQSTGQHSHVAQSRAMVPNRTIVSTRLRIEFNYRGVPRLPFCHQFIEGTSFYRRRSAECDPGRFTQPNRGLDRMF